MPDSIFHESMTQGITFFFFLVGGDNSCFPQDERVLSLYISGRGEILSYNELRQMGLTSLQ